MQLFHNESSIHNTKIKINVILKTPLILGFRGWDQKGLEEKVEQAGHMTDPLVPNSIPVEVPVNPFKDSNMSLKEWFLCMTLCVGVIHFTSSPTYYIVKEIFTIYYIF